MKTGAVSGPPPPVSSDVADDIASSSEQDPKGTSVPGEEDLKIGDDSKTSEAEKESSMFEFLS